MSGQQRLRIEVWSDVVCPWCYIGKRRLDKALDQFGHADEVEVVWRSFQLDPAHREGVREPVYDALARKTGGSPAQVRAMTGQLAELGAAEGLAYDFDRAVFVNTFDAHRLNQLGRAHGLGSQTHERLMRAHLIEGEVVDDVETLVQLGNEVGIPADEARKVLAGDAYAADVLEDTREAQALGASGVPFFVLNRTYGLSGAQPVDTFLSALRKAAAAPGTAAR
ncbi:DsbA family oxidoreductase [Streptomyces sp. NEAU-YJ-81]|uniref:DsbA family oxidoreductase n=1 Tax=Streptomyces sp. NEAU-YJ-81 TaxID=2820288 RepID=UPI001ABC1226|nr:DsbA family oxidoreductase [Streptomyces sp. NEAU-YJ-81]MBO3680210.1 DsbA family oxidoreductase [Streptomyces sp. NEAU-YJ-81]